MRSYNNKLINRARTMRRNMTPTEFLLWEFCLRKSSMKFRRQRPIDRYIVDFYCAQSKLAIEIDGESHSTKNAPDYDRSRTELLNNFGIEVLRFSNDEVRNNLEGVCQQIHEKIKSRAV